MSEGEDEIKYPIPPSGFLLEGDKPVSAKYITPAVKRLGINPSDPEFPYIVQVPDKNYAEGIIPRSGAYPAEDIGGGRPWIVLSETEMERISPSDLIGHELVHWHSHHTETHGKLLPSVVARQEIEAIMYGEGTVGSITALQLATIILMLRDELSISLQKAIQATSDEAEAMDISQDKVRRASRLARKYRDTEQYVR